jgi:hypothetical protein
VRGGAPSAGALARVRAPHAAPDHNSTRRRAHGPSTLSATAKVVAGSGARRRAVPAVAVCHSEYFPLTQSSDSSAPWYKRETWLALCLAAFVPLLLGTIAPKSWQMLLFVVSALLFAGSIGLLVRTDRTPPER